MLSSLGRVPVLLCAILAAGGVGAQRAIQLDVLAEWPTHAGDAAAEVSEFIADYAPELFWDYIKLQCEESSAGDAAVATAAKILPNNVQYLLETAVGLGTYAPAVRFFDSMSKDYGDPCNGDAFAVAFPGAAVHCSDAPMSFTADGRLDASGDAPAEWDHNYPAANSSRHVVLYGAIGSHSFCQLHARLSAGAQETGYRYSVRHSFAGAAELSPTRTLQGYGVHLDIKNMEYKNIDDSKDDIEGDEVAGGATLPDQEVKGINFRRLHERYPDLGEELKAGHETFTRLEQEEVRRGGGGSSADTMKAWKIADLGYQSVLSIITSEDPAWRMEQLLHNFPSQANSLSTLKVGAEAKQVLSDLHASGLANTLPFNSILVNGRAMDLTDATFGVYDLLDTIKQEYKRLGALNHLGLPADVKRSLAAAAVKVSAAVAASGKAGNPQGAPPDMATITRVDVSKGGRNVVQFVNNLEKDAMYMHNTFSRSIKTLLQPAWSLHMIAKNLYTVVAVVDLTTPEGRGLLTTMQGLYERQYPLRLGVVFASDERDDAAMSSRNEDSLATPSDILRLFAFIKARDDLAAAIEFAFYLSSSMQDQFLEFYSGGADGEYVLSADGSLARNPAFSGKPPQLITRQSLVEMSARYFAEIGGAEHVEDELFDVIMGRKRLAAGGVDLVAETREYLDQRGLPLNSFSFNGIVVESTDLESQLMNLLGREQYLLGTMVQKGSITDRTRSIFNVVLRNSDVHGRYHYILNEETPIFVNPVQSPLRSLVGGAGFIHNHSSTTCVDDDETLAAVAADTVLVLFPLTKGGVLSAISSMQWVVGNVSSAPRGTRLALVPLFSSDPSSAELLIEPVIGTLVELVNWASNERDRAAAVELISYFLESIQANAKEGVTPAGLSVFRLMVAEGSKFEEPLTPELAGKFEEVLGALSSLEAKPDRHTTALSVVSSVEASIKAAREEEGVETENDCAQGDLSACSQETYVVFNGRVMKATDDAPVHPLDLGMLSSLQATVTDSLLAALAENNVLVRDSVSEKLLGEGRCREAQSAAADLFLTLSAFCGSNAVGGPKRVDVKGMLTEAGVYRKSVTGVSRHFPALAADPAAYVAPAQLFTAELTPPSSATDSGEDGVSITIVVNPLTQAGQRAAAMIRLCRDHLQLPVHLVLIPPFEVSEFPIKNYYRFVSGASVFKALASFRQMPRAQIFTVRMDVPEAWNVQATYSPQDIDNLACDSRSCGDTASSDTSYVTYTLKNLLVAGQCYERLPDNDGVSPPNGLQLTLDVVKKDNVNLFPANNSESALVSSVRDSRVHSDTLVMQNLGYFQLQADAGMYFLRLAEGKARYLFTMEKETVLFGATPVTDSVVEGDRGAAPVGMQVAVKSFTESVLQLKVRKRPGMEKIPLLEDPDHKPSKSIRHKKNKSQKSEEGDGVVDTMWNSISSMFGGQGQPKAAAADDDTIHVFSLATGHVYERLLRIMMLSVSKRTKSPLKFWLFENFLSPTFKLLADEMSRKYGFEIGYVTYKWPKWLTEQTNKQRIIWGYKILFLDVLFPLNVKKVIYVDADQTVRADLKELWDTDLQGKPYGYVPFCTSRKETLGYQFWRSGYWESHLAGKPYHISALYVVDLTVFRRYAVGDRLRAVYDQLARDPNSLANLDQDLPNFAQHTVPIHSLPQEWLWCETWCSDKSKSKAKTIDLCNNPDKKEPKLDMARRIINGSLFKESWVELDEEVRALEVATGIKGRAE